MTAEKGSDPLPKETTDGEDEIVEFENITVKFSLSDAHMIAQIYPNCMTIGEVKVDLARKFEVDPEDLIVKQFDKVLKDKVKLYDTQCNVYNICELELDTVPIIKKEYDVCTDNDDDCIYDSDDPDKVVLDMDIYYSKSRLPDFITVHIPAEDTSDGISKNIVVEIENQAIVKPFIGGYRDKRTNIEYHDAFTLTGPNFEKFKSLKLATRITQTKEWKRKLIDTPIEKSTQAYGDATKIIHVSTANDYEIVPKKYITHYRKEKMINRIGKIILIQRNFRRYRLWTCAKQCAAEYRKILCSQIAVEDKIAEMDAKKRFRLANHSKLMPRTKEDFGLLRSQVENWKNSELKRIALMYSGAPRLAEVNIVLDKEIQLLSGIDRQRQIVRKAYEDYKEEKLLREMGETIKWVGYKDRVVEMDLLRTQRVRFLNEIYKELKKDLPRNERLALLNKVEVIMENEQEFPKYCEFLDLLAREKNLLLKTKYCNVTVLRQRTNMIFLELIKFNKEGDCRKIKTAMCECCKKVKPISEFALRTRQTVVDTCNACFALKSAAPDNTVYRAILRAIQRDERKHRCMSSYAFILQVDDIMYIVDKIWHKHSFLSKESDINFLRLPRWIKSADWSPWNCICLTESEARNHVNLKDLNTVYDKHMRMEIMSRHMLARSVFKKLQDVEVGFVESLEWDEVGIKDRVV